MYGRPPAKQTTAGTTPAQPGGRPVPAAARLTTSRARYRTATRRSNVKPPPPVEYDATTTALSLFESISRQSCPKSAIERLAIPHGSGTPFQEPPDGHRSRLIPAFAENTLPLVAGYPSRGRVVSAGMGLPAQVAEICPRAQTRLSSATVCSRTLRQEYAIVPGPGATWRRSTATRHAFRSGNPSGCSRDVVAHLRCHGRYTESQMAPVNPKPRSGGGSGRWSPTLRRRSWPAL